jgi:hypothetical protein
MDLFDSNELIFTDLVPPEATYSAPDGTLLARLVRTDGMVAKKRKRGNIFKWLLTPAPDIGGPFALRLDDASGRSLLTLRGATDSICDVQDADFKPLGRFEHDDQLFRDSWTSGLADRNIRGQNYFRAWQFRNPAGDLLLEIHTNEIISTRVNDVNTHAGGDARTITTVDGTQVGVWTDETFTFERNLPSPLRELVIATPVAIKAITPSAFYSWSTPPGKYVWERP